ncbi:MAG TPA: hypothetical protein VGR78_15945 [Verrucomicrobiae bacterium]|nr:hypothetical protein [Verrucomicrobiae bacterium]
MTRLAILATLGPIPTLSTIRALGAVIPIAAPVIALVTRATLRTPILVLARLIRTPTGTIIVSLRAIAAIAIATIPPLPLALAIRPCRIAWPSFKSFFARDGRLGRLAGFADFGSFAWRGVVSSGISVSFRLRRNMGRASLLLRSRRDRRDGIFPSFLRRSG